MHRLDKEMCLFIFMVPKNCWEHNVLLISFIHTLQNKQGISFFSFELRFCYSNLHTIQNISVLLSKQLWESFTASSIVAWQLQWVHTSAVLMSSATQSSIITAVVGRSCQVSWGWMEYKWSLHKVYKDWAYWFGHWFLIKILCVFLLVLF